MITKTWLGLIPFLMGAAHPSLLDVRETREIHSSTFAPQHSTPKFAPGWTGRIVANGLRSPDGIAVADDGTVYVAEETAGTIFVLYPDGVRIRWKLGLRNPEGLAWSASSGDLYAVEDVAQGRLVAIQTREGPPQARVVLSGLTFPEGVTVAEGGEVYFTESNVESASSPFQYKTWVSRWNQQKRTREVLSSHPFAYSYSGITVWDGVLYFLNEASGTGTRDSVFSLPVSNGKRELVYRGIPNPEGLSFDRTTGDLYVASESAKRGETGTGAVYRITGPSRDRHEIIASGFGSIEDVYWTSDGKLYVTDDSAGRLYLLERTGEVYDSAADL